MVAGRTAAFALVIVAAGVAASTEGRAGPSHCTPQHLVSAVRQVEAKCGSSRTVSDYRRGATIRNTGRVSQHSFCNGRNGAMDVVFTNRACALSELRKSSYTILTYTWSPHIHVGTDRLGAGATRVAQKRAAPVRTAARQRAKVRVASRQRAKVRVASRHRGAVRLAYRHRGRVANHAGDWNTW